MNHIFYQYSSQDWLSSWTFKSMGSGTSAYEKNGILFFRTLKETGRISPDIGMPPWTLQFPLPKDARIQLLFNGFCSYLFRRRKQWAVEALVPEPGVLWGRFSNIPAPVLMAPNPPEETEGFQWLEADPVCALLAVRNNSFCLITRFHVFREAQRLAEHYLEQDFEEALREEYKKRAGVGRLFEHMKHHDELAAFSAECLMRGLRKPEGNLVLHWSQSSSSDRPLFSINELYPLVLGWRYIDISVAEELILCALKLQANTGALPHECRPHGSCASIQAPKPLIVQAAEKVWLVRKDPAFLAQCLPSLRRYLQWALRHFDPKRRNLHCWQSAGEAFDTAPFQSDTATPDLTALLLCEIDAFNRMSANAAGADTATEPAFAEEREILVNNLLTVFWDDETNQFSNAYVHGKRRTISGFPLFVPLLWPGLPKNLKQAVLDRIAESDHLPGGQSVLSWSRSAMDKGTFPLLHQVITLEALRTADPSGQIFNGFVQLSLEGFIEWHSRMESAPPDVLDPPTAAFILNLQETRSYALNRGGRVINFLYRLKQKTKADRTDMAIIGVIAFSLLAIHALYRVAEAPESYESLKAMTITAYDHHDWVPAFKNCLKIIKYYPDQSAEAHLMAANIMLIHELPEKAEPFFAYVREKSPDSPSAMIGLGLALQMQGKFSEAIKQYDEFIYLFDTIFPELVDKIRTYRGLALEGFKRPPSWKNIYSYPIMHEL